MKRRQSVISVFAIVAFLALVMSVELTQAQTPSPNVQILEASVYRNVLDDAGSGDLLLIVRAELPTSVTDTPATPEAWCARLEITTGCTSDPVEPDAPTSLPTGEVFVTLRDSGGNIRGIRDAARIDHMLGGVYLPIGHGITWLEADVTACIEPSPTLFTPATTSCIPVSWRAGDTRIEAVDQLQIDMVQVEKNLEVALNLAIGTLVSAELITPAGQIYA